MRFFIFCLLLLLFDLTVFQVVQLSMQDFPEPVYLIIAVVFWIIPVALILWQILSVQTNKKYIFPGKHRMIRSSFQLVYFGKFIVLVLFFIGFLLSIVYTGFSYFFPGLFFNYEFPPLLARIAVLISGLLVVMLIYGIIRNRHRYQLHKVDIRIKNLPSALDGLKIIHISDIHSGSFTAKEPIMKGIQLINAQKPDLVFFTGDLVNSTAIEIEPYVDVFNKISSKYGVFSIFGNHDYGDYVRWPSQAAKAANLERLKNTQKQLGWQLLLNENRLLTIKGEQIAIIGVENYSASPRFSKYGNLAKAIKGTASIPLKLLLSHDPSHWDHEVNRYFKEIDITFSGHTHGAQFGLEIPGFFRWSPIKYVYRQWAGLYQKGEQYIYVNRGFGYLGYPGRVGILPEIALIKIIGKNN